MEGCDVSDISCFAASPIVLKFGISCRPVTSFELVSMADKRRSLLSLLLRGIEELVDEGITRSRNVPPTVHEGFDMTGLIRYYMRGFRGREKGEGKFFEEIRLFLGLGTVTLREEGNKHRFRTTTYFNNSTQRATFQQHCVCVVTVVTPQSRVLSTRGF